MSMTTPRQVETDEQPQPRKERAWRRSGSGDFSKPTLGGLVTRYVLMIFVLLLVVGPFVWQLSTSFKGPAEDLYSFPPNIIPTDPTLSNYSKVTDIVPVYTYAWHSLLIAVGSVITNVVLSVFAGYALACMKFRGKFIALGILLSTMLLPGEVTITANLLTINSLGLANTLWVSSCPARSRR